ncbi:uncharacterized protein LOC143163302 isoform X1 [Aptenodytes patagonicus]|uniref:uncharacterized protein LOC143163302 isoform X1 n=1 Tax=Aptenodytes patagonicus TaxID=9234 RepID=UPI003F9F2F71
MVAPRAGLPGAARDAPRQVRPRRRGRRRRGSSEGRRQGARHSLCSGQKDRRPREVSITSQDEAENVCPSAPAPPVPLAFPPIIAADGEPVILCAV